MKKKNYLISGIVLGVLVGVQAYATPIFPDVRPNNWFYRDVMNMVEWNVIQGNSDGTFAPSKNVNRAELSAMWNRYETHLEDKFVSGKDLEAMKGELCKLETTEVDQKGYTEYKQGDTMHVDGFEYKPIGMYKNTYLTFAGEKILPENEVFFIFEFEVTNVSNKEGYTGNIMLTDTGNTYISYSPTVNIFGAINMGYDSSGNLEQIAIGGKKKIYIGFDVRESQFGYRAYLNVMPREGLHSIGRMQLETLPTKGKY